MRNRMQTPPTPKYGARRRRRRSHGKQGVDAKLLKERLKAVMYRGQVITPDSKKIAEFLRMDEADVRALPSAKRLMLAALIDVEGNSSLIGAPAAEQRQVSRDISNGDVDEAAATLNASFRALSEAEENTPLPVWETVPTPATTLDIDAECRLHNLSQAHADSLKDKLKIVENAIRESSDCGNRQQFQQRERRATRAKLIQELTYINEHTLQPNIRKQEEVRQALATEAHEAIVGEFRQRFANLEEAIEQNREDARETRNLTELIAADAITLKKMQREAKAKMNEYHQKQAQQLQNVFSTLKSVEKTMTRVDNNTRENQWNTRLTREIGWKNAYGWWWVVKDFAKILTSVLFDDMWNVNASATRPLKQAFNAAVTLIEVFVKNIQSIGSLFMQGITCFESSAIGCLTLWALKSVGVLLTVLVIWYTASDILPTLASWAQELGMHMVGLIKWGALKLWVLVQGLVGDVVGKAWATVSEWLLDLASRASVFLSEVVLTKVKAQADASLQGLLQWIPSSLASLLPGFKDSLASLETVAKAGTTVKTFSSMLWPGNWFEVEPNRVQYRQWVLTTSPASERLTCIEEEEDETEPRLMLTY